MFARADLAGFYTVLLYIEQKIICRAGGVVVLLEEGRLLGFS